MGCVGAEKRIIASQLTRAGPTVFATRAASSLPLIVHAGGTSRQCCGCGSTFIALALNRVRDVHLGGSRTKRHQDVQKLEHDKDVEGTASVVSPG